ncbi:monovalent cation:proton antiporter-2 (CPA2) family protein [Ponticaulis sp.]|uniref:monovalent cation:proton antiporter-2 (CPA2) family protein n=1 Tax=Ponticaulis sp. TaxID=2020902 RepID=UPI000B6ECA2C|nr:monovalent cation:proton antiporter-2 (CPA2) family protein [Ponticaulis sp.]MAI90295.1 potassium transporter [Ponticaulis sp.]OUX99937.1 MAG: potassium transporter [Hyphomonadaceae bacterium TMED5]|tara:strand:+ start:273448 stop:275334 length:1887 start_codon:yes stop_codon:yes gene_type:complete
MTDFLLLAFIFLTAGIVAVPIATRLGLGSVLGYLIAGVLISPLLSLLHVDVVSIQHFAEFGVVIMLFLIGLELEPKRLWEMRARILGLGGGQVVITALLIFGIACAFDLNWKYSLAIGCILALSSTAIVLQTLNERGLMQADGGRASFSVLLFQDIAVIPMLALLPLLASPELAEVAAHAVAGDHGDGAEHSTSISLVAHLAPWQAALVSIGAIAAVILGGNYLTRPLFRFVAKANMRELFTASALFIVIGIALLMYVVGLSPALGTFLAGVVLANSEYRHELEADIEPFRGLLLGLFFMTVGAGINFALLASEPWLVAGLALGLIALKACVLFGLGTIFKVRGSQRWLLALGLSQVGEFGFVLLSFATSNAILPDAIADTLLLAIAITMLLTPLLFIFREQVISPLYDRTQVQREQDTIEEHNKVIIAGRGRMGGIIDRMLRAAGYHSTVIDFNSRHIDFLQRFGIKTYFGDASRPDLLHSAGISEAKVLIVAIDDQAQINEIVRHVLHAYPSVHVIARAIDRSHVYELWSLGCRDIVRETYDSSLRMGRSAFEALGYSRKLSTQMTEVFDVADRERMREYADIYDVNKPAYENDAFIARIRDELESWDSLIGQRMRDLCDQEKPNE